jgi:hypothetical protein
LTVGDISIMSLYLLGQLNSFASKNT